MARIIKFRAYCDIGDENKMIYFEEGKYDNGLWFDSPEIHIDEYLSTLMQFTGLHDKNGTPIYEGDVISDEYNSTGVVIWNKDDASFCIEYEGIEIQPFLNMDEWALVIGNIHENNP